MQYIEQLNKDIQRIKLYRDLVLLVCAVVLVLLAGLTAYMALGNYSPYIEVNCEYPQHFYTYDGLDLHVVTIMKNAVTVRMTPDEIATFCDVTP